MDLLSWVWPPALVVLAIWMVIQVRRHLRGRGRWLVVPMIATLLVFAIGGGLATVSAATASSTPTATGRMIDVGGHRLYIECTGSGGPAVILQAGLGASSSSWAGIAPAVAATTTVCTYDRAGHGRSDEAAGRRMGSPSRPTCTPCSSAPASPGRTSWSGIRRVDPTSGSSRPATPTRSRAWSCSTPSRPTRSRALPDYPGFYSTFRTVATLSPSLARIGLLGPLLGLSADESTAAAARGARDEFLALPTVLTQSSALTSIGDRPLIVVTAAAEADLGWVAAQESLPRLSTESVHRVLATATHNSLISGADTVSSSQAILDVLASVRTGTAIR